jgi:hypothetical protein
MLCWNRVPQPLFRHHLDMSKEPTIQDVLEAVHSLAEHMDESFATKVDLHQLERRMANRFTEVTDHIDEFVVLHRTHDAELAAVRSRCDRMEDFMEDVADKLDMNFERT